jgi:flagellar hook-length control protein FliK
MPGTIGAAGQGNGTAQNALAAAAAQANAAMAGSLPGTDSAAASGATPSAAGIAANAGLPQGAAGTMPTGTANRPAPQDLAAAFSSMVNRTETQSAANSDAGRLSISKTDNVPQMPKPLVKVDTDNTSISSSEPKASAAGTDGADEAVAATLDSSLAANDDSSDDFRSFGSYSPLLAGSGPVVIGKQVDPLVALRQQLANASVQDQIAVHIQRAVKESVDKISIQLSPTELGQIHVKMKVDDDKNVTATITVERPSTLDLLQRDTKTLERALQEAGLKTDTGSLSFSLQRGNQGDSSDTPGWGQGNGRIGSSGQENSASTAEISAATAGNEVDTANGLVNVAV